MTELRSLELPIAGMDCAECTQHVRHAIAALPGVASVEVYLAAEKAALRIDPTQVSLDAIRQAVKDAGYSVPDTASGSFGLLVAIPARLSGRRSVARRLHRRAILAATGHPSPVACAVTPARPTMNGSGYLAAPGQPGCGRRRRNGKGRAK